MPTYTALTTLMGEAPAQALGLALEELDPAPTGVGVFEVEDGSGLWEVGGYFLDSPNQIALALLAACLLYTSPSPRDRQKSRMPSSA